MLFSALQGTYFLRTSEVLSNNAPVRKAIVMNSPFPLSLALVCKIEIKPKTMLAIQTRA
jgi:hypothetical protein